MENRQKSVTSNNALNNFKKKVLNIEYEKRNSDSFILNNDLKYAWVIALIVICANLFWLISDRNVSRGLDTPTIFISLLVQVVLSIGLMIMSFNYKKISNINIIRFSFIIYYLFIIYVTTILVIQKNILASNSGIGAYFVGLSLSTCNLFMIVALPMPKLSDGILLTCASIVGLFFPLFAPGKEAYSFEVHVILRVFLILGYFAFRKYNINLTKKNMEIVELNNDLLIPSYLDFLTKAMNRRALDTYWDYLCCSDEIENVGVILFDIDYFKSYNDTYSHCKGDVILKKVSEIVREILDNEDNFLFRYGGEEFIIIFPNTSKNEILDFASKIRKRIYDENIRRDDMKEFDRITITCGCGILEKEDMHKSDYISASDKQLYIGKKNKRNCVAFEDEIF